MALGVLAGDIVLADIHNALVPITAVKSAATSRNTTTSFSADPHLVLPMRVGTFNVRGLLLIASAANAAGDFQYRWAWTGTMDVTMGGIGAVNTLASGSSADGEFLRAASDVATPSAAISYGASTTGGNIQADAVVIVTVAGNLTLEWTQLSSNANNSTLEAGSRITAFPVA